MVQDINPHSGGIPKRVLSPIARERRNFTGEEEHTDTTTSDATYKPEGSSASSSASGSGGKASADMMSVEEARLVLNVKKDDPFEVIQKVCPLRRFLIAFESFQSSNPGEGRKTSDGLILISKYYYRTTKPFSLPTLHPQ